MAYCPDCDGPGCKQCGRSKDEGEKVLKKIKAWKGWTLRHITTGQISSLIHFGKKPIVCDMMWRVIPVIIQELSPKKRKK